MQYCEVNKKITYFLIVVLIGQQLVSVVNSMGEQFAPP